MLQARKFRWSARRSVVVLLGSAEVLGMVVRIKGTEVVPTRIVSVAAQASVTGGGNSSAPVFSGNGRFVAFLSDANNLVTNDNHQPCLDVFVRDLITGVTTLVSVDQSGIGGANASCSDLTLSSKDRKSTR